MLIHTYTKNIKKLFVTKTMTTEDVAGYQAA
jgi:hypothetical protein